MLGLISQAMGKPILGGWDVFQSALDAAGLESYIDEYDDGEEEHDIVGAVAYSDDAGIVAD